MIVKLIGQAPRLATLSVLLLAVAGLLSGCDAGEPRYEVRARLLEHVHGSARATSSDCPVGGERRPALGCTPWRLRATATVAETGRQPPLRFHRDASETAGAIRFKAELRRPGIVQSPEGLQTPSITFDGHLATAMIPDFPDDVPPATGVSVWSRSLPGRIYAAGPLAIERGDLLAVGIGLDRETPPVGVAAAEFVLEARTAAGWRELLRETIRPEEEASWRDHRLSLDEVHGPATRFRFSTSLRRAPGTAERRPIAVPLWGAPEVLARAEHDDRPNIILVSLDTLRADYVGVRRGGMLLTPRIDALAAEGTVFENANTTFPSTTGAHLSMLTGLYPARLGIFDPTRRMRSSARTMTQMLAAAGWRTNGVTEAGMLAARVGFDRGFSRYWENKAIESREPPSHNAAITFDAAIEMLEQAAGERFFLFVHTYAVHFPYAAPVEYRPPTWRDGDVERPIAEAPPERALANHYAGDVRYADEQVGRLVDAIRRLGLERRTVLIVTSDHGEEFFEHGGWGHALTLYDEIMRVPLVIWGPGRVPAGRHVRALTSLVDLPPTILELSGVVPLPFFDGTSRVAHIQGKVDEDPERVVFGEVAPVGDRRNPQIVARTSTMKWILTESTPPSLVAYDLRADPEEQHPLDDPALLARGRALLDRYRVLEGEAEAPLPVPLHEETREQLRALGYLE